MMKELSRSERMLFALLRASLHEREPEVSFFQEVSDEDWKQCRQLAAKQGVMALAWDGVRKLPLDLQPPKTIRLKWGLAVDNYERKYQRYCQTVSELSDYYASQSIATMQLKGVGFSACYPVPSHREGGDIDIYTYSLDKDKMTDLEANLLADELMRRQGIEVDMSHNEKHSVFYYKGIPIENHKTFLNVEMYKVAVQVEALLRQRLQPQSVGLMDGKYHISVPSPEFNTLFLSFHAAQHCNGGLALHHLCDWAILISRYGLQLPQELTDKHFCNAVAAFTVLCNRYLGTSVAVEGGEQLADELMDELLHPAYAREVPAKNAFGRMAYRIRRIFYHIRIHNKVLYDPVWHRLIPLVRLAVRSPYRVFRKE